MPKPVRQLIAQQQPINWSRAAISGMLGSLVMMSFIDIYYLAGFTPFSFELYLGSLIRGTQFGPHNWTVGFLASLLMGSLFGIFYGYCFEYVFGRSNTRLGIWVSSWHILAASLAFFPFFGIMHEFRNTNLYPHFGILGYRLGAETTILLIIGHMLFGAAMGLFYGPVQLERARGRRFEPGETNVPLSEGGMSSEDDPSDSPSIVIYGG